MYFKKIKFAALLLTFIILFTGSVSCTSSKKDIFVTWMNTDGTLIESQYTAKDYDPTSRNLPNDSDLWHYTGWTISQSGNIIVCTANRLPKKHVIWKDYDEKIINETFIVENESPPSFDLPENNNKWVYDSWDESISGNEIIFKAKRTPNSEFFVGNIFQIVVNDKNGDPLGSGSGFVINEEGWFITNNHVMNNGYSASAYFDIKNPEEGEQYTRLKIAGGVYYDDKKDIFIGKLEGYEKIKNHYNKIEFTDEYKIGEISYSVGYPNSSTKIEINSGTVLEEYSDIYSKIDGIYYVLSDSYIAPGSSGGILVNENFEVIGITSMGLYSDSNKNYYISGGSIPYFLFKNNIINLLVENLKPLNVIYQK